MATKADSVHLQRLPLTRQRIAEAALRVIEHEGSNALTMKHLGSELGVEAMSLYFSNKDEILDEVVDLLFRELALPEEAKEQGRDWAEIARELCLNMRRHLLDHLNAVRLVADRPVHLISALASTEMSLRNLRQAGFDEWEAIDGHRLLLRFTLGYLICEASARVDPESHTQGWGIGSYLFRTLPANQMPTLTELAAVALAGDPDEQFDRCLRGILTALTIRREARLGEDERASASGAALAAATRSA